MNALKFWSKDEPPATRLARLGLVLLLIAAAVKGVLIRFTAGFQGDELFYTREVQRLAAQGLLAALTEGISFLYTSSGWLVSKITGDILLSNRLLSLLSLGVVLHALWGITSTLKIRHELRILLILTLLTFAFDPRRSPFLFGVNDPMLYAIFFQAVYLLIRFFYTDNQRFIIIAAILAGVCFWVREFALMYIAALMLPVAVWCFSVKGRAILQRSALAMLFMVIAGSTALLPHIPSLVSNGTPGFEEKNYMGNWRERAYLSQVRRIPSGSVFAYEWVDWAEVEAWKADVHNPPLPGNRMELIKRDPKMVADSFASNIVIRSTYLFTLRNGLLFLVFTGAFLVLHRVRGAPGYAAWLLLALFTIAYTLMISAVSLHRIEIRWLTPAIIAMATAATILLQQASVARFRWVRPLINFQYLYLGVSLLMILF
jgi:hypothetical protein